MNEAYQIKKREQMYEQVYENISELMWNRIEELGPRDCFDFILYIDPDVHKAIKKKMWTLGNYLNINHLHPKELYIKNIYTDQDTCGYCRLGFIILNRDFESQEIKKTIKKLDEMITQIYYSPGMPGYALAKENFEDKM